MHRPAALCRGDISGGGPETGMSEPEAGVPAHEGHVPGRVQRPHGHGRTSRRRHEGLNFRF